MTPHHASQMLTSKPCEPRKVASEHGMGDNLGRGSRRLILIRELTGRKAVVGHGIVARRLGLVIRGHLAVCDSVRANVQDFIEAE